ncbi:MAG: hypothetical protein QM669_06205 [Siphonobacter sp.]
MPKRTDRSKPFSTGTIIFNIIFILAYPIITLFYLLFNGLVWLLSLPSKAWFFIARRIRP